jgi:hypothetical protein
LQKVGRESYPSMLIQMHKVLSFEILLRLRSHELGAPLPIPIMHQFSKLAWWVDFFLLTGIPHDCQKCPKEYTRPALRPNQRRARAKAKTNVASRTAKAQVAQIARKSSTKGVRKAKYFGGRKKATTRAMQHQQGKGSAPPKDNENRLFPKQPEEPPPKKQRGDW